MAAALLTTFENGLAEAPNADSVFMVSGNISPDSGSTDIQFEHA